MIIYHSAQAPRKSRAVSLSKGLAKGVLRVGEAIRIAKTLDCVGLYCPEPLFQTRESMDQIKPGEILEIITDDPAAEEDLKRFAKRTGNEVVSFEKEGDCLRFLIRRGS